MTKEIEIEGFGAFAEALEGIYNRPAIPETTGATEGDVLTLGSDGPEWEAPSGGGTSYSTTEQEVGTWTNGSKLYSRTYSKTLESATNATFTIAEIDTGITIRKAESMIREGGYYYPGIYIDDAGNTVIMISTLENNHVIKANINGSLTWSAGTVFTVTIFYTKNTV